MTNQSFSKFRLFMAAYWAFMLSVSGMYTMYIVQIGLSKKEISVAVSILTISTLLGQNFIGFLADQLKNTKRILLVSLTIGVFAAAAMSLTKQAWLIDCLIFLWGFSLCGATPLTDAWYIGPLKRAGRENEFGRIRGLGSISYALSGVLIGFLLQNFGWGIYFFYITISASLAFLSILIITDKEDTGVTRIINKKTEEIEKVSIKEAFQQILAIKPLRTIVIILFMYYFVVKGIYAYLGVLLSDTGGGPLSLGVAYFFDASPEIITFFLAARILARFQSKTLIFASFIIQIIRLSLILVFNSPVAIVVLGMFSGLAYGLQASAYKTYIYNLAPEKYKVSCLSLSESIISLSGVICAPVFGFVIMKFGTYSSIAMGLVIDITVAIFIAINLFKEKSKLKKA